MQVDSVLSADGRRPVRRRQYTPPGIAHHPYQYPPRGCRMNLTVVRPFAFRHTEVQYE